MALPLVPLVIGTGLLGTGGLLGFTLSDAFSTALIVVSTVVGLFLVLLLLQRFKLVGG